MFCNLILNMFHNLTLLLLALVIQKDFDLHCFVVVFHLSIFIIKIICIFTAKLKYGNNRYFFITFELRCWHDTFPDISLTLVQRKLNHQLLTCLLLM